MQNNMDTPDPPTMLLFTMLFFLCGLILCGLIESAVGLWMTLGAVRRYIAEADRTLKHLHEK
jgi:hypothetical protein